MTNFLKYPSIENHYQAKFIAMFLTNYTELKDETFIIMEKIHGANIQIKITKDAYKVGKRNSFMKPTDSFYGLLDFVENNFLDAIKGIQNAWKSFCYPVESITLYGEYFGKGIQKGVYYGESKYIRFFDYRINNILQVQRNFLEFAKRFGLPIVPEIAIVQGLENALNFNTEFNSKISPEVILDNICEGVVIKPLYKNYYSSEGSLFYIKKKNSKFLEKSKQPSPKQVVDLGKIGELQEIFKTYINKNRVESVFSKHGAIKDIKQVSKYIKYVLEDATIDFLKDNDTTFLTEKELKFIYNVGSSIFTLLKEYL